MSKFLDATFVGTPGASISTLTPTTGGACTIVNGTMVVDSAGLRATSPGAGSDHMAVYLSATPPNADYIVDLSIYNAGGTLDVAGLLFRYVDANNRGLVRYNPSNGKVECYSIVGGSAHLLGSASVTFTTGMTLPIRLQAVGSVYTVFVNGSVSPLFTVTDTNSLTAAGHVGLDIYGFGGNGTRIVSVSAQPYLVTPPGAPTISIATATSQDTVIVGVAAVAGTNSVSGYTLYVGGTKSVVASTSSPSFAFAAQPTAPDGTIKAYTVRAYDSTGLEGPDSNQVTSGSVTPTTVVLDATQPNYAPAKPGDAMTLSPDYDASKNAASQTSVDVLQTTAEAIAGKTVNIGTNAADSPATQTAQAAIAEKLDAKVSDAVAAAEQAITNGTGDVLVNQDYGGANNLLILNDDGTPADNVTIRAYVKSAYDSGAIDTTPPNTITGSDGKWIRPLYLNPETYYLATYNPASKLSKLFTLVVS